MSSIKNVAIAGATGNLGPAIVEQLVQAGFNVTALTRSETRPSKLPQGADFVTVNYDDESALSKSLKGQDAVVSIVGATALGTQPKIVDAAVAAGVKFFIPSEFGCDTGHPKTSKLPVFAAKVETAKVLAEKAKEGKISYALIHNGAFLDWGVEVGFLVNVKGGTSTIYDGGDVPFSATKLADIGRAIAGVLKSPEQFKNKHVKVQSARVTQNQLLEAAKKASPGLETPINNVDTTEMENNSYEILKTGKGDIGVAMTGFVRRALFTKGQDYGSQLEDRDNEALGIHELSKEEVDKLVANIVSPKGNL